MSMYHAQPNRYEKMAYRRCGNSGLKLPMITLGFWHNFGHSSNYETAKAMAFKAFDMGVTHMDLANNYGPPFGSAEENFGRILKDGLNTYRDEILISTKAGYDMWPGPYGEWGSKKYLTASLDQSLKRMGVEYVDIFYSHRFDPETPLEETMGALAQAVRQGKALYVGVSSYSPEKTQEAYQILLGLGVKCLIHQPSYSMFNRWIEPQQKNLLGTLEKLGVGCIAFSPLAQGLLTDRYLQGVPKDSRAARDDSLSMDHLQTEKIEQVKKLNQIAERRGQSLAQMAIAWVLRDSRVTSALIGASSCNQLLNNLQALDNLKFSTAELEEIDQYATEQGIDLWKQSSSQT